MVEDQVSVCKGSWTGHIRNASHLCAPGWGVCSHEEQHMLSGIHWKQATSVPGCFAMNAAQDGGRCLECGHSMDRVGCNTEVVSPVTLLIVDWLWIYTGYTLLKKGHNYKVVHISRTTTVSEYI